MIYKSKLRIAATERARDRQRERMNAKERGNTLLMTLLCAEEGLLAGGLWRRL